MNPNEITLSEEQQEFINQALNGENILVDACIGSGKTTAIQYLCNYIKDKQILYLTYNKLLKVDAQSKIKGSNIEVNNYHGLAYKVLSEYGIRTSVSNLIQTINTTDNIRFKKYDILIIDEYQDIEEEMSDMLYKIKQENENLQIIAVGDMQQKIYDKTRLDVSKFIYNFIGKHVNIKFTYCFRLNEDLAKKLGIAWDKTIIGVNKNCKVSYMNKDQAYEIIKNTACKDLICLGKRVGELSETLNRLEEEESHKFNKTTVYASIRDKDNGMSPREGSAIFTTFDSSKGMERKTCVIFDWDEGYLDIRLNAPQANPDIVKNIFCVAASRGKNNIIFVKGNSKLLTEQSIPNKVNKAKLEDNINLPLKYELNTMLDFKYRENIEDCYKLLNIRQINASEDTINVKDRDGMINLCACIDLYQKISYFDNYNIDTEVMYQEHMYGYTAINDSKSKNAYKYKLKQLKDNIQFSDDWSIEKKVLYIVCLRLDQYRYIKQVKLPFITKESLNKIHTRIAKVLSTQEKINESITFKNLDESVVIQGRIDVLKDTKAYKLIFSDDISHEDFITTAMYSLCSNVNEVVIWNIKNNEMHSISIKDKDAFLEQIMRTVTKEAIGYK